MAKEKRSAADLDAELAALEAELAALEGNPKKAPKAKKEAPPTAPPAEVAPSASPEPAPAKKGRFALPKFGKKEMAAAPASAPITQPLPEAAPAPQPASAPQPDVAPAPHPASYDATVWRQEERTWVRTVSETPVPVIRRVLDDQGNVIREEPAVSRDVEEVSSVKAERGLGRLLRRK